MVRWRTCGLVLSGAAFAALLALAPLPGRAPVEVGAETLVADTASAALDVRLGAGAFGVSGALRARVVDAGESVSVPLVWTRPAPPAAWYRWVPVLGTEAETPEVPLGAGGPLRAPAEPGVYELELGTVESRRILEELRLVVRVPYARKQNGRLGRYRIGEYPASERGAYAPPRGFIEVTREGQELRLSEHFRIHEFLTHDQQDVWPKYVVVDEQLLEKLELVMAELAAMGIRAERTVVMSGYRTPQYNRKGLNQGRASLSRHQYGDAADVWIDNDGDWYMDDLNGDGRRDTGDARVMLQAVERVEARHPELVGGAGIYRDNGVHGPFIHIDTRGRRARW